jgi:hypothetical protein
MILGEDLGTNISSVFIELGYVMQRKIPITIFQHSKHKEEERLPNLLYGAASSKDSSVNAPISFKNFEDILEIIKNTGVKVFGI